MYKLRDYQQAGLDKTFELLENVRRVLLVAPTGAGKTVVATHLISKLLRTTGRQVLFLAHRRELIKQCAEKLSENGIIHGIIMGGVKSDPTAPVQVASVQAIARRTIDADVGAIITDECHHAAAGSYLKVMGKYPDAVSIGLTATPYRTDGKGLGDMYDAYTRIAGIDELTARGYLAPARYWSPSIPDLGGVQIKGKDFDPTTLSQSMSRPVIIGNIVRFFINNAPTEKAICFAVDKAHGEKLKARFIEAGVQADFIHDGLTNNERDKMLRAHRRGKIQVLININILSEGYDDPSVSVCICARPTMSLGFHVQSIGRVLRPWEGKQFAKIFDHTGNVRRLGFIQDYDADLSSGLNKKHIRGVGDIAPALRTCKKCFAIFKSGVSECPVCGTKIVGKVRTIISKSGNLEEITKTVCSCGSFDVKKRPDARGTVIECAECGKELRVIMPSMTPKQYYIREYEKCLANGWKTMRASIMFKNRYGKFPDKHVRDCVK